MLINLPRHSCVRNRKGVKKAPAISERTPELSVLYVKAILFKNDSKSSKAIRIAYQ